MPMTIAVTRNAPERFDGFLASCMLAVAPGVYVAPDMDAGVRSRIWDVILDWAALLPEDGGVMLLWRESEAPSGLDMRTLGWPKKEILDHEGIWLTLGALTAQHDRQELASLARTRQQTNEYQQTPGQDEPPAL